MKAFLILLFCFIVYGCVSTPESNFYVISDNTQEMLSKKKLKITIYDISLPQYVDRPQIVLQKDESSEIKISEFNRWASDLSIMLKNAFIDNLRNMLPNSNIYALAYGIDFEYVVIIEVEEFIGRLNQSALLKVNWQILNTERKEVYTKRKEYITPVGKTYESYVLAQCKNIQALSFDVAESLK